MVLVPKQLQHSHELVRGLVHLARMDCVSARKRAKKRAKEKGMRDRIEVVNKGSVVELLKQEAKQTQRQQIKEDKVPTKTTQHHS